MNMENTYSNVMLWVIRIHPSMALQPLPGLGLPHKTPQFISIRSSSPPSTYPSSCSASLWTTSAHPVLGLPTGLVVWKFPFRTFFEILSSSILITWPAHSSLLILMSSTMFGSSYRVIWIRKVSLWLLDSLNVFRAKYLIRRQQCVCVCVCVVCVCKCVGCVCGVCVWCVCVCV